MKPSLSLGLAALDRGGLTPRWIADVSCLDVLTYFEFETVRGAENSIELTIATSSAPNWSI